MKVPGGGVLKSALLDPAVNLLLQRLRQELSETRTRLDDTQNELSAWKFTPDRYEWMYFSKYFGTKSLFFFST